MREKKREPMLLGNFLRKRAAAAETNQPKTIFFIWADNKREFIWQI